jgi:SET domain
MSYEVLEVEGEGRSLFATQHLSAGDTVLACPPLVCVPDDRFMARACYSCLQLCTTDAVVCTGCKSAVVCGNQRCTWRQHKHDNCQTLLQLAEMQAQSPDFTEGLLGGDSKYLRLLLRLLLSSDRTAALAAVDNLEGHWDDMCESEELSAVLSNTVLACKALVPSAARASSDRYADLLCKLYCNAMTIGAVGYQAARTSTEPGYWSGIRGGLYTDHGIGVFPVAAIFNHSCAPNCYWQGQ